MDLCSSVDLMIFVCLACSFYDQGSCCFLIIFFYIASEKGKKAWKQISHNHQFFGTQFFGIVSC